MPIAARLHRHRRDDTVGGAFQQVPNKRSADAEAHRHELTNAEVVHQLGRSLVEAIAALHRVTIEFAENSPGLRVVLRFLSPDQQLGRQPQRR